MGSLAGFTPRRRRRLAWALGVLGGGGAILAALNLAFPYASGDRLPVSERPGRLVVRPPTVPLTAADRREINRVLDVFIPGALERRDPGAAWDLAAPIMRGGVTRAAWQRGEMPVYPYHSTAQRHGWIVEYSIPKEAGIALLLQPAADEPLGPISWRVTMQKIDGRWRVAAFYPAAVYEKPERQQAKVFAQPDAGPGKGG